MKWYLTVCVGVVLFLLPSCASATSALTVYFIPYAVDTYVPVTPDDITCRAWEKWTITDATQASNLISLLTHGEKGDFSGRLVRMLVSSENKNYYVDQTGVVLVGKSTHKIDLKQIDDF
jgi:hypothetical protein